MGKWQNKDKKLAIIKSFFAGILMVVGGTAISLVFISSSELTQTIKIVSGVIGLYFIGLSFIFFKSANKQVPESEGISTLNLAGMYLFALVGTCIFFK